MTKAVATARKEAVVGFISRENYVEFRAACVDGAALPSDYGAFMKDYNRQIQDMRAEGISPTQVFVRPSDLVAWCKANGRAVDSKGRLAHAKFLFAGLNFGGKQN